MHTTSEDSWREFEITGSVQAYLAYRAASGEDALEEGDDGAQESKTWGDKTYTGFYG